MWLNRPGLDADAKFQDMENELSLSNLKNEWLADFPDAEDIKDGDLVLVDNGSFKYLVTKKDGVRYRAVFTAF